MLDVLQEKQTVAFKTLFWEGFETSFFNLRGFFISLGCLCNTLLLWLRFILFLCCNDDGANKTLLVFSLSIIQKQNFQSHAQANTQAYILYRVVIHMTHMKYISFSLKLILFLFFFTILLLKGRHLQFSHIWWSLHIIIKNDKNI